MSDDEPRVHRVRVLARVPHPGRAFTQGLLAEGDVVWESSGGYGASMLCRYRGGASEAEVQWRLPDGMFGEGICRVADFIWQLTWRERVALRWDTATMTFKEFPYNRDGWGICADAAAVYTSDGSSEIVRRDPGTLRPLDVIQVRAAGWRVRGLNDLAFATGRIWANIAGTAMIAGINPATGQVIDVVDAGKAAERRRLDDQAIMNGIAALPADGDFLLTGKRWRWIRHVRLELDRHPAPLDRLLAGRSR